MVATKEQERTALKKIREIVESLGDDSYIGIAFEGVLQTAEENIENDWACSLAQDLRNTKEQLAGEQARVADLVNKYALEEALRRRLQEHRISNQDKDAIADALARLVTLEEQGETKTAQKIVEEAENPSSTEFKMAVAENRNHTSAKEAYKSLADRVRGSIDWGY